MFERCRRKVLPIENFDSCWYEVGVVSAVPLTRLVDGVAQVVGSSKTLKGFSGVVVFFEGMVDFVDGFRRPGGMKLLDVDLKSWAKIFRSGG